MSNPELRFHPFKQFFYGYTYEDKFPTLEGTTKARLDTISASLMSDFSFILTPLIVIGTLFLVFSCLVVQKISYSALWLLHTVTFLSLYVLSDIKTLEVNSILFTSFRVAMWLKILGEGVVRLNRGPRIWKWVILVVLSSIESYLLFMAPSIFTYPELKGS
jgi:hypothetical protein